MHTSHLVLIKAESHDDALDEVRSRLEPDDGQHFASGWSDWAVVGDGDILDSRYTFTNCLSFGENDDDIPEWDGASQYAVSLDDEADLFYKALNQFYGYREAEFDRLTREVDKNGYDFVLDGDSLGSYALYRLAQLSASIYCLDSFVYDLENYSANLKYFREDVAADGRNWYAVLVDFHF